MQVLSMRTLLRQGLLTLLFGSGLWLSGSAIITVIRAEPPARPGEDLEDEDGPDKRNSDPQLVALRATRRLANDRGGAKLLTGRWMMTLPAGFVHAVSITQLDNGCLQVTLKGVLSGEFAVVEDRLELVKPREKQGINDFVWRVENRNRLNLVVDKNEVGAIYLQAKLERLAENESVEAEKLKKSTFRIPAEVVRQAREQARLELATQPGLKARRPAGLSDLSSPGAITAAVDRSMQELSDKNLQYEAMKRLRYLGEAAFEKVSAGASSPDPLVAGGCCYILANRGPKAIPTLSEALKSANEHDVRRVAAESLGHIFHPSVLAPLVAALQDTHPSVISTAVRSLSSLRDRRAIGPLMQLTKKPAFEMEVQQALRHIEHSQGYMWWPPDALDFRQLCVDAETLKGESYGPAEIAELVAKLSAKNDFVRSASFTALGKLNAHVAVPAIMASQDVYGKLQVLAQLGTPEAVDYLVQRLGSLDPSTRNATLDSLASGAGRWATPLLIALLDDPSLKIAARNSEDSFKLPVDTIDSWPESHLAHQALNNLLSRHGLKGRGINLADDSKGNNVPEEMARVKKWWAEHGVDFLAGKPVPNPNLTSVWFIR